VSFDPWVNIRNDNSALGATLLAARIKADMTQPQLVTAIDPYGVHPTLNVPALSRIERGEIIPAHEIAVLLWEWMVDRTTLPPIHVNARSTDPQTSHDAARSVNPLKVRALHRWWLNHLDMIWRRDPHQINFDGDPVGYYATDEGARKYYDGPKVSSSGFRTRRAELRHADLVEDSGLRFQISTGRHAIAWQLTPAGRALIKETPPS
jgi:hypothetical protein